MSEQLLPYQCDKCEYPLAGLPRQGRCPECGNVYDIRRSEGVQLPLTAQGRFDRRMRRLRTLSLGCMTVFVFSLSLVLTLVGFSYAIYSGLIFAIVFALWTATSYVYEREER